MWTFLWHIFLLVSRPTASIVSLVLFKLNQQRCASQQKYCLFVSVEKETKLRLIIHGNKCMDLEVVLANAQSSFESKLNLLLVRTEANTNFERKSNAQKLTCWFERQNFLKTIYTEKANSEGFIFNQLLNFTNPLVQSLTRTWRSPHPCNELCHAYYKGNIEMKFSFKELPLT